MTEILQLEKVNKIFNTGTVNENHVTKDFDLTLRSGDFVSVIGSNGAGKSTLLNLIAGTQQPTSGSIKLNGKEIANVPAYKRAKYIARVFQDPQMGTARNLTIEENLAVAYKRGHSRGFSLGVTDQMRQIFKDHLKEVDLGLEDRLTTDAGALSGGQRQVLTLLMAVLQTPDILLLDEHTAALDPRTADMVMNLTEKLVNENHITSLMITHDMSDAIRYGNRLIMLHEGKIAVDVAGQEKADLTVDDLMNLFQASVGASLTNDEILLQR
ncbi:ABC transporter ATP-binding protein [Aerococcus urinaehominis]|uniref:ABC transporter ATP-binding protein n=1 Tax=Aerococcus urinaehominis TaxID=128944 RepID=A0A109RGR2_9LACT|nr:ATP-binding cassette domain-containing protein [Aerococcus urinaehominis]AMB99491.1 ABC transporter ATP-binding protein [Aerococcus urinaehominis]SDM26578.1 putative ABC transport system ATP-binding protein [Aerococcus urinaehominis]